MYNLWTRKGVLTRLILMVLGSRLSPLFLPLAKKLEILTHLDSRDGSFKNYVLLIMMFAAICYISGVARIIVVLLLISADLLMFPHKNNAGTSMDISPNKRGKQRQFTTFF